MGEMIEGQWHAGWYKPDAQGRFDRPKTRFRARVAADGSTDHPVAPGRYHLYVSYACPWAHRTLITRALRGLESAVAVSVVDPHMGDDGWEFTGADETTPDALFNARFLSEVYARADAQYTGRVTVPVLWDTARGTIVNNESREVMRMLDTEFDALATRGPSLYPESLRPAIDAALDELYEPLNNGVYRAGFAASQPAYEAACRGVFAALDRWEAVLSRQRFVCGDALTEADVAAFTTLLRFDPVYHAHFKCNLRRVQDYPNLWGFVRDVYQTPGVAATCKLDQIKTHYYWSQTTVNPTRVVPLGPPLDLTQPHGRDRF